MKKIFTIALLLSLMCTTSFSTEVSKEKKIKELFELIDASAMMNTMTQLLSNNNEDLNLSENQISALQKEMTTAVDYAMKKQLELYDRHFTEKEIDEILKFYKTQAGKKILEETPEITEELFTDMMKNYYPGMKKRLENIK